MKRTPQIILTSLAATIAAASLLTAWPANAASDLIVSRNYSWHSDRLVLDVPAHVHFQPAPVWHLSIRGPQSTLDRLEVTGDEISARNAHSIFGFFKSLFGRRFKSVDVDLSGPALRRVTVNGSGHLLLSNLNQDALDVRIEGSGSMEGNGSVGEVNLRIDGSGHMRLTEVTATKATVSIAGSGTVEGSGTANDLDVSIAGSGTVRLPELKVADARVSISGSGNVEIAPTASLSAQIAGSGSVRLDSHPEHISWHVSGSGTVVEAPAPAPAPAPAASGAAPRSS
jgi:hypothetical protein